MAVDMFLKIDGIDGESTDDKHKKWIEIDDFNHSVSQPVTAASKAGGRVGGRADFADLVVTKTIDLSTPSLYLHCSNGKHIPKVELEFCLATDKKHTFMKYTLEDVIVSSVSPSGSITNDVKPGEQVTFAYGKITWEYTPIDHAGRPGASQRKAWDLEANKQM
jgi:type VI secretion system secreted protein Hcp